MNRLATLRGLGTALLISGTALTGTSACIWSLLASADVGRPQSTLWLLTGAGVLSLVAGIWLRRTAGPWKGPPHAQPNLNRHQPSDLS